jgi:hypothetical protein
MRPVAVAFAFFAFVGCRRPTSTTVDAPPPAIASSSSSPSAPTIPREPWISSDPYSWPQLVLTNDAAFRGHTPLRGASSFLIRNAHGQVFGVTARHLIGADGGVEPEMTAAMLFADLAKWTAFPRTKPEQSIDFGAPAIDGLDGPHRDWLVLSIADNAKASPPAYPLRLRATPAKPGESLFLIGCSYADADCRQAVFRGSGVRRNRYDYFQFRIDLSVDLRGFSGAPILDTDGHVVGVMSGFFSNLKTDAEGKYLDAAGEDVGAVYAKVEASP